MKKINKIIPNVPFEAWKSATSPTEWEDIDGKEEVHIKAKRQLKKDLTEEQGYICCYCGRRIDNKIPGDVRAEHIKSRKFNKPLSLQYHNLLASCHGNGDISNKGTGYKKSEWRTCDAKKSHSEIYLSPLSTNIEEKFICTEIGTVIPHGSNETENKLIKNNIIDVLNLNSIILVNKRKALIKEQFKNDDEKSDLTHVHQTIFDMDQMKHGEYEECCYFIKKYAETLLP